MCSVALGLWPGLGLVLPHTTLSTKTRKEPVALPQMLGLQLPSFSSATEPNSLTSRANASDFDLAHTPVGHTAPPPLPAPHASFPRCVPWADGAQLDMQSSQPTQVLGALQTITRMEARGFPWCALHSHPAKKRWTQPKELETPRDTWNNLPLVWIDIAAATRLIVFFLEQSWKSLKGQ